MIETKTLFPGVTLRTFQDFRFKQGAFSIQFVRPMSSREAALNALLPSLLLRGTRRHPTLRAITEHLDMLYGASVSPLVRRIGDLQTTGLYLSFMEDRFALPGDQVLAPMLSFLKELLLEPLAEDDTFLPSLVESEKKNLISAIESDLNDKRAYAMGQLFKTMCREDTFGIPRLGEPEQVEAITPKDLFRHYQEVLRTSPIELFYVGSAQIQEVARLLTPIFDSLPRVPLSLPPQSPLHPCEGQDKVEIMDVSQGKLCMGFVTPITNQMPEFPAMQVMNTLFGSGMTSKLFMNIREKMSLCYSIGSGYYGSKGIVAVSAGIDFQQEPLTRQEILAQLRACQTGEISEEELTAAKEALLSTLRATHDSPGSMEGYYATAALSGLLLTPQAYMDAIAAVTREDVIAAANTLTLHTTYFLKGGSQ